MHGNHLVNHIHQHELRNDSTLHVVGVCSNSVRYHSRYRIAREWIEAMCKTANVKLHIVECAFGDRHHELKDICKEKGVNYLELRNKQSIWIKENMINLGVKRLLPHDWKYMAWIDMDVFFRDPHWALETIHQLQHFQVVQPWSDCADLGPQGNVFQNFKSFGHQHQKRIPKFKWPGQPYPYAHSGFAWACTRAFWEAITCLMDFPILGSSDHHSAFAMINEVESTIHRGMGDGFFRRCREWQERAIRITKREVGFVMGRIEHQFHGPKKRRYYRERWQILIDHKFCPDRDLMYNQDGIITLVGKPALEQAIHQYNLSRCEDGNEET